MLYVENRLHRDETFRIFVDGETREGTALDVPAQFHLKLEQVRESNTPGSAGRNLRDLAAIFLLGGRKTMGISAAAPEYAVWEADCAVAGDGRMVVGLGSEGGLVRFCVETEGVETESVSSRTECTRENKARWLGNIAPYLVIMTTLLLALPVMFWTYGGMNVEPAPLRVFLAIVFSLLPLYGLVHIWRGAVRAARGPVYEADAQARQVRTAKRITVVFWTLAVLFAMTALSEVVAVWLFHFGPVLFAPFPCTVVLIVALWTAPSAMDQKTCCCGAVQQALDRLAMARNALLVAYFSTIVAMLLAGQLLH